MAFTTITDGDRLSDTTLWTVVEELKTAVNERHVYFSDTPITWSSSMYRDERGGDAIERLRNWIDLYAGYFVKTGEQFLTYGATGEFQTVTGATARGPLMTEAGWDTSWITNDSVNPGHVWHVADPRIWQQIQDAIELLVTLKTWLHVDTALWYEARIKQTDEDDNPTTQTIAWNSMLAQAGSMSSWSDFGMVISDRDSSWPNFYSAISYTDVKWFVERYAPHWPVSIESLPILRLKTWLRQRRGDADLSDPVEATDNFGRVFSIDNGTNAGTLKITVEDGANPDQVWDNLETTLGYDPDQTISPLHTPDPESPLTHADILSAGLQLDGTIPASPPFTGLSATVGGAVRIGFYPYVVGNTKLLLAAHDLSSLLTYG